MRKVFLMVIAAAAFMLAGAGPALAGNDDGGNGKGCKQVKKTYSASSKKKPKKCKGNGNACPKNSKNPGGHPPNCGHPPKDTCHDGKDNDYDGKKDMADDECQNPNDGNEDGKPKCPPNSPNPHGTPPNCGQQPPPDTCHDGKDNDYDGKTDMADEECQNPNDGDENGDDKAPAGNCAKADLVLLTEDVKILCLYFGQNGENATTSKDCPDALLALPLPPLGGGCLFLPPADSGAGSAAMPALPTNTALPSMVTDLLALPGLSSVSLLG
jgi:hypothetical protein